MTRAVSLPAFAKINLRLHILGKRPDGYHELRTIFQTISLHDTLELSLVSRPGIRVETDDAALPTGRENLVWRALEAVGSEIGMRGGVQRAFGQADSGGAGIGRRIERRRSGHDRPVAADAQKSAAGAADRNRRWNWRRCAVFSVWRAGAGGEPRRRDLPVTGRAGRPVVVVSPADIGVSTRDAYRWATLRLTKRAAAPKLWSFCALCWSPQGAGLSNDFEAPVFRRHPRLGKIKRALLQQGAAEAALAGSGSAVFGICRNPTMARRAAQGFPKDQVFVVETLTREDYRRHLRWRAGA